MKLAVISLAVIVLAIAGGVVAAQGQGDPPIEDPLLVSGAKRYAAYLAEETASLRDRRRAGDLEGERIHRGRIAPSVRVGVDDPLAVTRAAAGLLSGDARDVGAGVDLLDVESHAAGASAAFDTIREAVWARDRGLVGSIDERMATLRAELDRFRRGERFVAADRVAPERLRSLRAALDAWAWRLTLAADVVQDG